MLSIKEEFFLFYITDLYEQNMPLWPVLYGFNKSLSVS